MEGDPRTLTQNKALHLYFTQIADALREKGLTMNHVVKLFKHMEIAPTSTNVKENIWRPIQMALFKKPSTTELKTEEVTEVYENVSRFLAPMGISIPFPSEETLMQEELAK